MIRVRRAGLVSFAVKMISIFTGLAFVILITSNVTTYQFALWNIISSTLIYVLVPNYIISFWATRARARGSMVASSVLAASLSLSVILTICFVLIAIPTTSFLQPTSSQPHSNMFYFLLSAPQVLLYTLVAGIEGMLWGSSPEKQSYGFASFEVAKIVIGFIAFVGLHLRLEGAILAVMGAQIVQLMTILFFARKEYSAPISLSAIRMWFRSGWPSVLQNLHPMILNLDLVIVAALIPKSVNVTIIAYFAAARIIANVVGYSDSLAYGLYPSILSGVDPRQRTNIVLELQFMIVAPMVIGASVLGHRLLYLLNPNYQAAAIIVLPLSISYAFYSLRPLVEAVILGSEKVDLKENMTLKEYFGSKLFVVSKIDLTTALGYLLTVIIFSVILSHNAGNFSTLFWELLVGAVWGVANLGRSVLTFALKLRQTTRITKIKIPVGTILSIVVASAIFGLSLWTLNQPSLGFLQPAGGKIWQAAELVGLGSITVAIYGGVLYALSKSARQLVRAIAANIF